MNEAVRDDCTAEKIEFTRCRPYRKNDQAHVEQKNGEQHTPETLRCPRMPGNRPSHCYYVLRAAFHLSLKELENMRIFALANVRVEGSIRFARSKCLNPRNRCFGRCAGCAAICRCARPPCRLRDCGLKRPAIGVSQYAAFSAVEWALSSAVEHYLDMVGVRGSIPLAPTIPCLSVARRPHLLGSLPQRIDGRLLLSRQIRIGPTTRQ